MSATVPSAYRPVVADALIGRRNLVIDASLVVAGVVLVAALAQVAIPLWPVPITGQTLGVVIVGSALGARRGAISLALYLVAGLAGAPIFAAFGGGILSVTHPDFGYIIGFIPAAFVMGLLAERSWDKKFGWAVLAFLLASCIPFVFGLPYLAIVLGSLGVDNSFANIIALGLTPFIVGGVIKAMIAAGAMPLAWKGVRALDARKDRNS